ncbi:MAG: helix-turn-helix transcriptional regulator [Proteobacteria bacterium]|nr:helix-turn-helix transcriptional regulator [Pseudomonadota bacterium]
MDLRGNLQIPKTEADRPRRIFPTFRRERNLHEGERMTRRRPNGRPRRRGALYEPPTKHDVLVERAADMARHLRSTRIARDVGIVSLASVIGVAASQLSSWEHAASIPSIPRLIRWAHALDQDPAHVFGIVASEVPA